MSGSTGQVPDTLASQGDWAARGACVGKDPEIFFSGTREREAKQLCLSCPVRTPCLAWVMDAERGKSVFHRDGIVAALTGEERTRLDPTAPDPPERQEDDPAEKKTAAPAEPRKKAPSRAPKKTKKELAKCGTNAAYRRHIRRGETVDAACLEAHRLSTRRVRYASEERKVYARWIRAETDAQIAAAVGMRQMTVRRIRERLGLLPNVDRA